MEIVVAGASIALSLAMQRLESNGHTIRVCKKLEASLLEYTGSAPVSCLVLENYLISLGTVETLPASRLTTQAAQYPAPYAELIGHWHPAGVESGFILFVGASSMSDARLVSILNALAPSPHGWLHCGPVGSASFTARVFNALMSSGGSMANWCTPGRMPRLPDWAGFFSQQQALSSYLLALSKAYLTDQPYPKSVEMSQLLNEFSRTPSEQTHYARNLANLLLITLDPPKLY